MLDAKLVVVGGHANKGEVKLKLPMTIGRNPGLGLTINHNMVSRLHCQIYERDGALIVRDNNSSNGTFINNERINVEAVLKPGDRLQCGPLTFVAIYQHSGDFPELGRKEEKPKQPAAPSSPKMDNRATQMFTGSLEALAAEESEGSPFAAFEQPEELNSGPLGLADLVADSEGSFSSLDEAPIPKPAAAAGRPSPEFSIFVQMNDAGPIKVGTPVRAAGVAAGSVVHLEPVEVGGQTLVQAMLSLPKSLGAVLRDDLKLSIGEAGDGTAVFEISSPGGGGKNVGTGHTVRLHGTAVEMTEMQPISDLMDDVPEEDELGVLGTSPSLAEDDGLGIFDSPSSPPSTGGGIFDTPEDDEDDGMGVLDGPPRDSINLQTGESEQPADITSFFSALTDGFDDDEDSGETRESEQTMDQDALSLFQSGLSDESSESEQVIRLDEIDATDPQPESSDPPAAGEPSDNGSEDLFKDYKFDDLTEDEYHR